MEDEVPEFLGGLAEDLDSRPHLIAFKIGKYSPRKFKKGVRKMCKYFSIPNNLTSLIAVAGMHDYELAIFRKHLFLFRIDSTFADMVTSEPAMLHATFEMESDHRIIQYL
jgi:hypothetical protein